MGKFPSATALVVAALLLLLTGHARNTKSTKKPNWKTALHSPPQRYKHRPRDLETIITPIPFESDSPEPTPKNATCSLCQGAKLLAEHTPIYDPTEDIPANWTCANWDQVARDSPESCEVVRGGFYTQCCDGDIPLFKCERNIRQKLLGPDSEYDAAVPPIVSNREPLNVTVQVIYQTVQSLDVQGGTGRMFVTISMVWNDPRLAWEVSPDQCAGYINVYAGIMDPQITEIWAPDWDIYNQIDGVQQMPNLMAKVYSDGTVVWSRNGGLGVMCQFTGLAQMPFDTLGCQLIFGAWVRDDPNQVKYSLMDDTKVPHGQFKPTYNEYQAIPDMSESGYLTVEDATADGEATTLIYFNFFFKRSQNYYIFNLIVSQMESIPMALQTWHPKLTCTSTDSNCHFDLCEYGYLSSGFTSGRTIELWNGIGFGGCGTADIHQWNDSRLQRKIMD